jgi:hypothetical protein
MFRKRTATAKPRVGIFWLVAEKLVFDTSALADAENYANHKTHSLSHADCWSRFQRDGLVPNDLEYEDAARGRVVHDARASTFTIFADRCILKKRGLVKQIFAEMNLSPANTQTSTDSHYRCAYCLRRTNNV